MQDFSERSHHSSPQFTVLNYNPTRSCECCDHFSLKIFAEPSIKKPCWSCTYRAPGKSLYCSCLTVLPGPAWLLLTRSAYFFRAPCSYRAEAALLFLPFLFFPCIIFCLVCFSSLSLSLSLVHIWLIYVTTKWGQPPPQQPPPRLPAQLSPLSRKS